jgi:hypothetical protein
MSLPCPKPCTNPYRSISALTALNAHLLWYCIAHVLKDDDNTINKFIKHSNMRRMRIARSLTDA